jgi:hypothetical protein
MAAELLKLLAHHGRNAKKGQRKLKAVKPNRRAELNYAAELLTITRQILAATKSILLPELKALKSYVNNVLDINISGITLAEDTSETLMGYLSSDY